MEPFNAGWLSLLPPVAAIVAALISREVISALLVGILTGAVIYTSSTGGGVIIGSLDAVFSMMVSTLEFKILIFTSLLGRWFIWSLCRADLKPTENGPAGE